MKKHTFRRWLSLMLVIAMVVMSLPLGAITASAAAPASYTDITVGQETTISVSTREGRYFRFIPTRGGTYTIASFSLTGDAYVYLLDAEGNQLAYDDDSAGSLNFSLTHRLEAGQTYYVNACAYSSNTATYTFSIVADELDSLSYTDITVDQAMSVSVSTREGRYFRFIPTRGGTYTISSYSLAGDAYVYLLDAEMNEITHDDDSAGSYNFRITRRLEAGVTYYINACAYGSNTATYTFKIVADELDSTPTLGADVWDGTIATSFGGGSGTSASPYLIKTAEQLAYLASTVNSGTTYSGKYFKLMNNIDLANRTWTPIGRGIESTYAFAGYFNGNYATITNLYITGEHESAGLFGCISTATIEKLAVTNATVDTYYHSNPAQAGVLCGYASDSVTIRNIMVSGEVEATSNKVEEKHCVGVGLLLGCAINYPVTITDCYGVGNVYGEMTTAWNVYAGGLLGRFGGTMTRCYFNGSVNAKGYDASYAGGLIGIEDAYQDAIVSNSFALGTVTALQGTKYTSGICTVFSDYSPTCTQCYYAATCSPSGNSYGTSTAASNFASQSWVSSNLGWDFTNTWTYVAGYAYPVLRGFDTFAGDAGCAHEYDNTCDPDCNVCGATRAVTHTVTHVPAVDPTYTEEGNIEYWYCTVCGCAWLDAACTLNTNLLAVILPVLEPEPPTGGAHSEYNASTGDVFLGGNYLELGISQHGSFGTSVSPSVSGFHCGSKRLGMIVDGDGWDVGNAPTTGDFFLPDTPEERYILAYTYRGSSYQYIIADRNGVYAGSWLTAPSVSNQSSGDQLKAVVTGVTTHNVRLELTYSFGVNDKFYKTDVKIINNSGYDISDVRFVRSFDPDQDDDIYDTNYTYNKVICNPNYNVVGSDSNYAMVVARGARTLEGFYFIAFDNRAYASQGVDFDPSSAYLTGLWYDSHSYPNYATDAAIHMTTAATNGYAYGDTGIAITFNLDTIPSAGIETARYYSSLSPTVEDSLEDILEPVAPVIDDISGASMPHGYTTGGPSISVSVADNHTVTYQWYRNTTNSNTGGVMIAKANAATYNVPRKHRVNSTEYYYCVVTATRNDNGLSAQITSEPVPVEYLDGEHNWQEQTYEAPTCLEDGFATYKCTMCITTKEEILPASDHTFTEWIIVDEPICTAEGYKYAICATEGCGYQQESYIPALGHNHQSVVTSEATCDTPGIITHTCSRCGDSFQTNVYAEHRYELVEHKDGTCLEDGYNRYACPLCHDSREEIIPGSHNYEATVSKTPTAVSNGEILYCCSICGHTYTEIIPARHEANVLLIQDRFPWDNNDNVALLNQMVIDGYISGWDMATTTEVSRDQMFQYSVILIANDQTTTTYDRLGALQEDLVAFAEAGGVVIYGACDAGWAGGYINYRLPGGVRKENNSSSYNYIVDMDHPVVTGTYTDGKALTNSLLYGSSCSHTAFFDLPANANVILENGSGDPTLVEYPMGNGHIIVSGLTWEFYYNREAYDGVSDTTYSRNVYDDLVYYALLLSNQCNHAYGAGEVVAPTCTEQGYTLYTCTLCGAVVMDAVIPALGHDMGDWEIDEDYHRQACVACDYSIESEHVYDDDSDRDCNECGGIRGVAAVPGDSDGDGKFNIRDLVVLMQYINCWDVEVYEPACDINGDGKINNRDLVLLTRMLNGWE